MIKKFGDKKLLLILPLVIILSTAIIFLSAAKIWGSDIGYLVGFAFYWLVWGIIIPIRYIGFERYKKLFTGKGKFLSKENVVSIALFIVITGIAIVMYYNRFLESSFQIILIAIPIAIVNAICEEVIWRGLFIDIFKAGILFRVIVPSMFFALSHISPQLVKGSEGGMLVFIISTFFLGLGYGYLAHKTKSIKWTIISHSINGIIATGGFIVPSILNLI